MTRMLRYWLNPQCSDASFLSVENGEMFQANPIAISVKPWRGRHHVYSVFMLSSKNKMKSPILLTVKGAGRYRKEACMVKEDAEKYPAPPGYYFLRVHLKTRVAIVMILRGLLDLLRDPANWTLTYTA